MSDFSQGPGWWIASDDKWYPPHLHPSVRIPDAAKVEEHTGVPAQEDVSPDAGRFDDGQSSPGPEAASPATTFAATTFAATTSPDVTSPDVISPEVTSPGSRFLSPDPDALSGLAYGGAVFGATSEPAAPGPGRRSSRRPLAAGVSLLVVILLVLGGLAVFGGSKSASAEVIDAVNSTLGDKTAQVTIHETLKVHGSTITGSGPGSFDLTHNALQAQMTLGVAGQQVPIVLECVGGVVYEKVPGLDQISPGKSWISIDVSSLQQASAGATAASAGTNPSVMLRMLAQQGNQVVALGPSTVDGVAVNGYAVTIKASTIQQKIEQAHLPSWMRQAIAGLKAGNVDMRVFVDNAGHLRSLEQKSSESSPAAGPVSEDETMDFSHYGAPVSVTAPPADQVISFQQFLQDEQAQLPSAS
jgi:hypothetical protein